jgi:hypothetical protein
MVRCSAVMCRKTRGMAFLPLEWERRAMKGWTVGELLGKTRRRNFAENVLWNEAFVGLHRIPELGIEACFLCRPFGLLVSSHGRNLADVVLHFHESRVHILNVPQGGSSLESRVVVPALSLSGHVRLQVLAALEVKQWARSLGVVEANLA